MPAVRWIWPQSEEQTKYAQVRFCLNRAAESLRSLSALQATRCHVKEQVGRGSGGLAFSLSSRLSESCKRVLKVCKCFKLKLPLDTCAKMGAMRMISKNGRIKRFGRKQTHPWDIWMELSAQDTGIKRCQAEWQLIISLIIRMSAFLASFFRMCWPRSRCPAELEKRSD